MAAQGFHTILFMVFLGFLVIFASYYLFSNYSPILSYEVTDQNSEGVFSSLSRDLDKTIEEINNNDNSDDSEDRDTPTSTSINTADSNEKILNSTSSSDTPNSNNDVSNSTSS